MFDFLFKKKKDIEINDIYEKLREIYNYEDILTERKEFLTKQIETYGYLRYPFIKALEELTPAEILFGLEQKWIKEGVFENNKFKTVKTSPVARANIKNSNWIKKEGHNIKLINLAALGNGNVKPDVGRFIDWLRQLLILPSGNKSRGILATTIYLIPFHPREFGCAYMPTSTDVSKELEDEKIKNIIGLNAKTQVQTFITLAQLAGHPVIYDILPQVGRFSKTVLAHPHIARWFDIIEFRKKVDNCIELVSKELERKYDKEDVQIVKEIYKQGSKGDLSQDYQAIYDEFEKSLKDLKKANSENMLTKNKQLEIQKKARDIILKIQDVKSIKREEDITKQNEIIQKLMEEGLWTAPGGAWCSAGVPAYDRMSDCESYPIFKHYDYNGKDVSEYANLDCQTPLYFAFLENGELNQPVIETFINYLIKFQNDYNFDGFRIDHLDHIIDELSEKNGKPISYRVPRKVLKQMNSALKENFPYFATIAEHLCSREDFEQYNQDMGFDLIWGNDIPAQSEKNPEVIMDDNLALDAYNTQNLKLDNFSVLKTYNNQDGEFEVIDRYPGQLGEKGALFKWFKYKFLPGGKNAQRPVLYVDGDESFTKTGIEKTIGREISMEREFNQEFFEKFDAIDRFAKNNELISEGEAQIITQEDDGFVCWIISKEPLKESFLIVANYLAPIEKTKNGIKEGQNVKDKKVILPGDFKIKSEFVFEKNDFVEKTASELTFDYLAPSEFKIFLLTQGNI